MRRGCARGCALGLFTWLCAGLCAAVLCSVFALLSCETFNPAVEREAPSKQLAKTSMTAPQKSAALDLLFGPASGGAAASSS